MTAGKDEVGLCRVTYSANVSTSGLRPGDDYAHTSVFVFMGEHYETFM